MAQQKQEVHLALRLAAERWQSSNRSGSADLVKRDLLLQYSREKKSLWGALQGAPQACLFLLGAWQGAQRLCK